MGVPIEVYTQAVVQFLRKLLTTFENLCVLFSDLFPKRLLSTLCYCLSAISHLEEKLLRIIFRLSNLSDKFSIGTQPQMPNSSSFISRVAQLIAIFWFSSNLNRGIRIGSVVSCQMLVRAFGFVFCVGFRFALFSWVHTGWNWFCTELKTNTL